MINAHCFIGGNQLSVGYDTFINYGCFFDLSEKITIGDSVHIAMKCSFITSSHQMTNIQSNRAGDNIAAPITIGNGCWLGANVCILPGTSIGEGTVIAAGSVVLHDCDENCLYAGVPARKIRNLVTIADK